jgi:predicted phage replisome organizer
MEEEKKEKIYYWLRLDRNFFKRHDIRIIENMENGDKYVLFYMKLLLESIDHVGNLRFNDLIPYNDSMLATITNTNIDIVRSAVKLFQQLDLMEMLDDQTIYMTETQKMLGEAKSTNRVKRFREKQKLLSVETVGNVTETLHETEIEIEKESDKDINKKNSRFVPPTLEEVRAYCNERNNQVDTERFIDFYSSKGWMVGKNKMKDWKACVRTWEKSSKPQQPKPQGNPNNQFNRFPQRQYTPEQYAAQERALFNKTL